MRTAPNQNRPANKRSNSSNIFHPVPLLGTKGSIEPHMLPGGIAFRGASIIGMLFGLQGQLPVVKM